MKPAYQLAAADSTPVMVVSNFFTGHVPENEAVMTRLLGVVSVQEPSYAASGSADPEMAGYEVLGLGFAKAFPAAVQLGSANDYIVDTYASAFGRDASGEQVIHFLQQEAYFFGMYVSAGLSNEDASVQARGVVIGQILCWAVREEGSPLNTAAGEAASAYLQGGFDYGKGLGDYAVEPVIVETPGETVYVPVPTPVEPAHDIVRTVDGVLDRTSEKASSPGELFIGNGGNMNTGFQITEDKTASIEVGFKVHDRGGADRLSTSVDADGKVHIDALAGVQAGVPGRGATAVDVSINLGLAETTDAKFKITMGFDTDETIATNFNVSTFNAAGNYWANAAGLPVMGNDGARNGTGHLIQDATNSAFGSWLGTADAPEGVYDAYVSVLNLETGVEVRQEIVLHLYDMI